jgi:hypothetical protein
MITEFNKYIYDEPEIGDYVYCEEPYEWAHNYDLLDFLNNNIGRIIDIEKYRKHDKKLYMVTFDNIPNKLIKHFPFKIETRAYYIECIKIWSKNREEVETYITSKKYNI